MRESRHPRHHVLHGTGSGPQPNYLSHPGQIGNVISKARTACLRDSKGGPVRDRVQSSRRESGDLDQAGS